MGKGYGRTRRKRRLGKARSGVPFAHSGLKGYEDGGSTCPHPKDLRWSEEGEGSMPISKPTRQTPSMEDQGKSSIYSALPSPVQGTGCPRSWQPLALSVLATVALVSFRGWLKCSSELRIKFERGPKGTVPILPFPLPTQRETSPR